MIPMIACMHAVAFPKGILKLGYKLRNVLEEVYFSFLIFPYRGGNVYWSTCSTLNVYSLRLGCFAHRGTHVEYGEGARRKIRLSFFFFTVKERF